MRRKNFWTRTIYRKGRIFQHLHWFRTSMVPLKSAVLSSLYSIWFPYKFEITNNCVNPFESLIMKISTLKNFLSAYPTPLDVIVASKIYQILSWIFKVDMPNTDWCNKRKNKFWDFFSLIFAFNWLTTPTAHQLVLQDIIIF